MRKDESDYVISFLTSVPEGAAINKHIQDKVLDRCQCVHFKRNQKFVELNEQNDTIGIIVSGIFKSIYTDSANKKEIVDLFFPVYKPLMTDWNSYNTGSPAEVSIISKKESIVICISKFDIQALCISYPCLSPLFIRLMTTSTNAHHQLLIKTKNMDKAYKIAYCNQLFPGRVKQLSCKEKAFWWNVSKNRT